MIEYRKGNMFECSADCLVNTVNCEGFMGKGIAYQFKMRFPKNNQSYIKACKSGELTVGKIHYYVEDGITIVNFPTKNKWREPSRIEYVENGMSTLVELLPQLNVRKIAIPPLGCGNGGLFWDEVKKVILGKIAGVDTRYDFVIFEPSGDSGSAPQKAPQISVPGLVLLDLRMRLKRFNMIRLQKSGYFVNLFLREEYFKFDQWKDGPHSGTIDMVAKNIKEYQAYYKIDSSQATFERIYQVICSEKVDRKLRKLHIAVEQAVAYVNKIQTDKKLEGVAAVLYLVQYGGLRNEEQIIIDFKNRLQDKAERFPSKYIMECIDYLKQTNIIQADLFGNLMLTGGY